MHKMNQSKTKRRPYRRQKLVKKQQRQKKRSLDNNNEIEATIKWIRANYIKKIKLEVYSDVDTNSGTSFMASQDQLLVFSNETSTNATSCPSNSNTLVEKNETKKFPSNHNITDPLTRSKKQERRRKLLNLEVANV